MPSKDRVGAERRPRPASRLSPEPTRKGAGLEDLSVRDASDPTLGLTNTSRRPAEDWAANTGPTRAAESSSPAAWDPLGSQRTPPSDKAGEATRDTPGNLGQCLVQELQDLYQVEAEQQRVLQKMAGAASADELRSAFEEHLSETERQVERLGQILELLGEDPGGSGTVPPSMRALLAESRRKAEATHGPMLDLIMISEWQKMEHNEIASYGTARAMAHTLGRDQEAHLLQTTLVEEEQADQRLTRIALRLMKETASDQGPACEYPGAGSQNGV